MSFYLKPEFKELFKKLANGNILIIDELFEDESKSYKAPKRKAIVYKAEANKEEYRWPYEIFKKLVDSGFIIKK